APRADLVDRVAVVVICERLLVGGLPAGHVVGRNYAAMALAAFIHHLVAAGEALDLLGDEAAVEGIPRPLDLLLAAAAAAFGLADDTPPCARQRLIAEKLACLRHPSARCIESGGGGPLALE